MLNPNACRNTIPSGWPRTEFDLNTQLTLIKINFEIHLIIGDSMKIQNVIEPAQHERILRCNLQKQHLTTIRKLQITQGEDSEVASTA